MPRKADLKGSAEINLEGHPSQGTRLQFNVKHDGIFVDETRHRL